MRARQLDAMNSSNNSFTEVRRVVCVLFWFCAHLPHMEFNFSLAKILCPAFLEMYALSKAIPSARPHSSVYFDQVYQIITHFCGFAELIYHPYPNYIPEYLQLLWFIVPAQAENSGKFSFELLLYGSTGWYSFLGARNLCNGREWEVTGSAKLP